MSKNYFEDNYKEFEEYYDAFENNYKKKDQEEKQLNVESIPNREGGVSLCVNRIGEKRKLMLSGIYEPTTQAQHIVNQWGGESEHVPFYIIGMGNVPLIEACAEEAGENGIVIVYEPSFEIFQKVLQQYDLNKIIGNKQVYYVIEGINSEELASMLQRVIKLDLLSLTNFYVSSNYTELFPELVKEKIQEFRKAIEDLMVGWNTATRYSSVVGVNSLNNLKHYYSGYNVSQLAGFLGGEVPAIIVSAGPSLNKNILELKRAKGKACIIAVDTAIKPLLNNNIVPDFFAIVDGKKPTELMNHPRISEVPLVTCLIVAKGIMDLHKGKKFFYSSGSTIESIYIDDLKKNNILNRNIDAKGIPTGGSVANTAFALAHIMNASRIILVGQDLALTNNQSHANGTFKKRMNKLSKDELKGTFEVDGIHGNKVLTRPDFDRYRKWFEEYIESQGLKDVYDATQGGARIHGTKLITLKRAIEKFCIAEYNIQEKLEKIDQPLDYYGKLEFIEMYNSMDKKFKLVKRKAAKGYRLYKELYDFLEGDMKDKVKYREILYEIEESNQFMNNNSYALYVQQSMVDIEYAIRSNIYRKDEDEIEDLKELALQGQTMNRYIWAVAEGLVKYSSELIEERPLEQPDETQMKSLEIFMKKLKDEKRNGK